MNMMNAERVHDRTENRGDRIPRFFLLARFKKKGPLRFLSQAEVQKTLIRLLRLAGFPLVYSQGFHPRPRISFGRAVKTGVADLAMYALLELLKPVDNPAMRFNFVTPKGLELSQYWWNQTDYLQRIEGYKYRILIEASLIRSFANWPESISIQFKKNHVVIEYSRNVNESDLIFETVEFLTSSRYPRGIVVPMRISAFPEPGECGNVEKDSRN